MKYIILNDLWYLIKEKYRLILLYISVFILYFFLVKDTYVGEYYNVLLNNVFGLKFNLIEDAKNILNFSFILLNFSFYIYLAFCIFINDLENLDNLFPRISLFKWLNSKLLSQTIICFFINILVFIIPFLFRCVELNIAILIIKKIIFLEIIITIIYCSILLKRNHKILFAILILILLICTFIPIDMREINFVYLIIFNFLSYIVLAVISHYTKFSDLKE